MAQDFDVIRGAGWWRATLGFLAIAALAAALLDGQATGGKAKRTLSFDSEVDTGPRGKYLPRWNDGMLVGYATNFSSGPILYSIDRSGYRTETLFALPDGARINLMNIALSNDGEIALVGSALSADSRGATFVARIAADRQHQTVTRIWPYCAVVVTFAPDGTVWTVGHLKDDENTRVVAYNVLRRFDHSGKVLGSTTIRTSASRPQETSYLFSSADRVGWFTREREFIEFSLDGTEIGRYEWPEEFSGGEVSGVATSDGNDVIASWSYNGRMELLALDRTAGAWQTLALPALHHPVSAWVLGFDGTTLVTTTASDRITRFRTKPE